MHAYLPDSNSVYLEIRFFFSFPLFKIESELLI